jgi:diadenosine tetraphosphate (Ap4A) HIT family hydrolase
LPVTPRSLLKACDYCDELAGGHRNAYVDRYGESADRVILDTSGFRITPTLGQIAEGHLLIVPHDHVCALADLPQDEIARLEDLCQRVRSILTGTYGECIFFEHGIRNVGSGGCGIDHAHMHAVPVPLQGAPGGLRERFKGRTIRHLSDITIEIPDSSYIFFEDCSGSRSVFTIDRIPSQYMRKLVADSIGKSDWDWRKSGYEADLVSAVSRLSPLFSPLASAKGR